MIQTEQRRKEILAAVQSEGKVRVSDLSRKYGISEVSIRNDLEAMEIQGLITRVHGGAIRMEKQFVNMNLDERYMTNYPAKRALAAKVAELVRDNDTIVMNAGTTMTYVLRALQNKRNISIVTNSIQNAAVASAFASFNVILLGGQIDGKYQFTFGQDTIHQLDFYRATKCILSIDGISTSCGLTLYYPNEAEVIHKMMDISGSVIVAADSSKIGRNTFTRIAPINRMHTLVTNHADEKAPIVRELRDAGIAVYEA